MDVSKRSLWKDLSKIAIPLGVQGFLISLIQLIDNLFAGNLENQDYVLNGLNAINNVTFNVSTIVLTFIAGVGMYYAKASGDEDLEVKHNIFTAKLFWTLVLSFAIVTLVWIFLQPLLSIWLSKKDESVYEASLDEAMSYGKIVIPSMVVGFISVSISSTLREDKKIRSTIIITTIAIAINTILNYPFMYTMKMGIKGAGWTTLISKIAEFLLWIIYILFYKPTSLPKLSRFLKIKMKIVLLVFPKVLFWTINQFLLTLGFTVLIIFMSNYSSTAGTPLNVAGVFTQLMYGFIGGYTTAMSIVMMSKLTTDYSTNKNMVRNMSFISIWIGLVMGLAIIALSPLLFVLYRKTDHYLNVQAVLMVVTIGACAWFNNWTTTITTALKAGGKSKSLIFIDASITWMIILPIVILLTQLTKLDLGIIYLIQGLSGVSKLIFVLTFFVKTAHKLQPLSTT